MLTALDAQSSRRRWDYQLPTSTAITTAVLTDQGRVYVGADALYALDAQTGRFLWRISAGSAPLYGLALDK
jgi:outer membrane protein assembly factor BamB